VVDVDERDGWYRLATDGMGRIAGNLAAGLVHLRLGNVHAAAEDKEFFGLLALLGSE
jgi:hypothetical protein